MTICAMGKMLEWETGSSISVVWHNDCENRHRNRERAQMLLMAMTNSTILCGFSSITYSFLWLSCFLFWLEKMLTKKSDYPVIVICLTEEKWKSQVFWHNQGKKSGLRTSKLSYSSNWELKKTHLEFCFSINLKFEWNNNPMHLKTCHSF